VTKRPLIKSTLYLLLLLGLVTLSGWLLYKTIFRPMIEQALNSHPEIILDNVTGKSFDETGTVKSRFSAPKLFYYSSHNNFGFRANQSGGKDTKKHTKIIKPHIILYSANEEPWVITADYGEISDGNKIYKLIKNVKLKQKAGKNNQAITITTSELTLFPKKKMAQTDKFVTLIQQAKDNSTTIITSIGARAYQKTGIVDLLSHMKGRYKPAPQSRSKPSHKAIKPIN